MPQIEETIRRALRLEFEIHVGEIHHLHAPSHLVGRDRHQFQRLHHIVRKPAVEVTFDPVKPPLVIVGKTVVQLFSHQRATIAQHIINQWKEHHIGENVVHTQRHPRTEEPKASTEAKENIHY